MPPEGGAGMPLEGGWITDDLQPAINNVAANTTRPALAGLSENLADGLQFICSCLSIAS